MPSKDGPCWLLSWLIVLVAPPTAFLVTFAFFGAPIYRYQAGLHPFMLATIVVACGTLLEAVGGRRSTSG